MEQRFGGHDFSEVRIHDDARADASARAIAARAFAAGHHVVFEAGAFAPDTSAGRRLLAHELAHVVQQARGRGRSDVAYREPAPTVRPASDEERLEYIRDALRFLRQQGQFFAVQTNVDVSSQLRHLTTTFDAQVPVIGLVADPIVRRRLTADLRTAYSDAVRVTLLARTRTPPGSAAIRTPPTLRELYEQHRDEIEPFALPQAVADTGANELSQELTSTLPARPTRDQRDRHAAITAARQRIRMLTNDISFPIDNLFSTVGARTTIPLPTGTTVRYSSTIPTGLRRGLSSVAGQMLRGSPILISNSTVILALDLTDFGGDYSAYRFTRVDLGGQLGVEVWIERQGSIGIEGVRSDDRATMRRTFDGLGFVRGSGFSADEFDQVLVGVTDVPSGLLSTLSGLRFERDGASATDPAAAAEYDQERHTITVFDRAFASGRTRFGRPGRTRTFAASSVVHELGHALDLHTLRTTAAATTTAQDALLAVFGTGGRNFRVPARGAPDRAQFEQLNRAVTQASAAQRAARALSGARWSGGNPSTVTDALARGARQPDFRAAAIRDGGRAGRQFPTTYPSPRDFWQEYFAECFAMYITNPGQLQQVRPNVFAFMQRQFP